MCYWVVQTAPLLNEDETLTGKESCTSVDIKEVRSRVAVVVGLFEFEPKLIDS